MPTFYQRIQNAIKGFNQDTNPNYNKFIYSTMGNNVIANNQNDDNFISKGYQKNPTIYSIINLITKCASAIPFQVYEKSNETQLGKYRSLTTGLLNKFLSSDIFFKKLQTFKLLGKDKCSSSDLKKGFLYIILIELLIIFGVVFIVMLSPG